MIPAGPSKRFTSLLDITPTLVRIAKLEALEADGLDLADTGSDLSQERSIFLETGFNPALPDDAGIDVEELVRQGAAAYEISEQGLLQVRREYHDQILAGKKKGVTDGRFIVSTGPGKFERDGARADFKGLEITAPDRILTEADIDSNVRLEYLKSQLERYYADEL